MRFNEFRIVEAAQPGYYTVGDSHAVGMANYAGRPWISKGKNGTSATNSMHPRAIDTIPQGSVVAISVGANDTFARNPNPGRIASSVKMLVDYAKAKGLKVSYVLFPVGTRDNKEAREQTRDAIKSALAGVNIVDLEGSTLVDGVHADSAAYKKAAASILSGSKVDADPAADAQADDAARRPAEATELRAGPPYPRSAETAVRALQNRLGELGYSLGSTGADGKYGPRTTRAVRAFKKDNNIPGDGLSMSADDLKKLAAAKKVDNPTPTGPKAPGGELGPLSQDSVTQGKIGQVLNFIAGPESRGRYDAVYPGRRRPEILDMTLEQLFKDMRRRGNATGSSASGRYQYIRKTLESLVRSMGLDPKTTKFDQKTQDEIVIYHLRKDHGLENWLAGRMSNPDFLNRLARTWAGIPNTRGVSNYVGVLDNKAGIGVRTALANLDQIQSAVA